MKWIGFKFDSLIMSTSGCSINDYVTVVCVIGGFIISEILPHCPGVKANGITHFLTILLEDLSEVQANKKVKNEGTK